MSRPSTAFVPPRQERSRETTQRLVAAAIELLSTRTVETLSVADVAAAAGVSVGGFYARFPSKDALIEYLYAGVLDGLVARMRAELDAEVCRGLGVRAIVRRYVGLAVQSFRAHRTVLRQIALRNRTSADATLRARVLDANRALHGVFRARLHERRAEMRHPRPAVAVDVALTAVSGAMREYVLFSDLRPQFDPVADDALVDELTDLFCRYLDLA